MRWDIAAHAATFYAPWLVGIAAATYGLAVATGLTKGPRR